MVFADSYYRIEFRYQPHLVEAEKQLPGNGKRWEPGSKCWLVPISNRVEVERFACKYGFKWGGVKTEEQANFVIPHARTHIRATGIETYVVSFIRRRAYN